MESPCDTNVKWILRAGFNVEPSTLAKNLTILCTFAFSATVLCVMYSNSGKRPHFIDNNIQVCFPDDEEMFEEDHTIQCKTRCRHSIVGSSDKSKPPDSLMNFGILLEDVIFQSSRQACRLDSTIDINLTNDRLIDSGTLMASSSNTTNDVAILDSRQDNNCLKSSQNNNAETQTLPSLTTFDLNSFLDVNRVAEVVVDGKLTNTEISTTSIACGPDEIGSSCAQPPPSTINTTSSHRLIESLYTQTPPSIVNTACGPDITETFESLCTQTPPLTTNMASGLDRTVNVNSITSNLDNTSLCEHPEILPLSSSQPFDPLSNSNYISTEVSTPNQPFDLFKECNETHKDVQIMRENIHFHCDPNCSRAQIGLLRHCKENEPHIRSQKELNVNCEDSVESPHLMEDKDDGGSHFEGYIYGIIREKGSKSYKRRLYGGVSFIKEKKGQGNVDCSWENLDLGEKIGIKYPETCTQIDNGKTYIYGSTRRPPKIIEEIQKTNFDTILCKDKGTNTYIDIYSDSSIRGACIEKPMEQAKTISKEKTHSLLEKKFEKCRDNGTSTKFVDTFPTSSTKALWMECHLKQIGTMPKEDTHHLINNNIGLVKPCIEERREEGFTSVHSQSVDPLEQTKNSLKALTKTQHWSKMSLPEQYEYLGLLDSTLAAASGEY